MEAAEREGEAQSLQNGVTIRQNCTRLLTIWRFNLAISELFCDKIGPGQLHPSEIWQPLSGILKLKLSFLETYDKI